MSGDQHDYERMSPEEIEREMAAARERAKELGPDVKAATDKALAHLEKLRKGRQS